MIIKSKEEVKYQEMIQPSKTHDPGRNIKQKYHTQESQEVSPLLAGNHKAARNRQDRVTNTYMKHKWQKGSTKNHCLEIASKLSCAKSFTIGMSDRYLTSMECT